MKFFPPSRSSFHLYKVHLDYEIHPISLCFLFRLGESLCICFLLLVFIFRPWTNIPAFIRPGSPCHTTVYIYALGYHGVLLNSPGLYRQVFSMLLARHNSIILYLPYVATS